MTNKLPPNVGCVDAEMLRWIHELLGASDMRVLEWRIGRLDRVAEHVCLRLPLEKAAEVALCKSDDYR